jgi:hypothetical protein
MSDDDFISELDDEFVEAPEYVKRGDLLVLRTALPATDPESWPSLWRAKYGGLGHFPWAEVFGSDPTVEMLVHMGLAECPFCGQKLTMMKEGGNSNV